MSSLTSIVAHHSEAVDPTLIEWIRHEVDRITGLDSDVSVLILGSLIVLFPVVLLLLVWRQRRSVETRARTSSVKSDDPSDPADETRSSSAR